jgi:fumarylacetoacetase
MIAHRQQRLQLAPGDLFGIGTISGPTPEGYGSLMELSADGTRKSPWLGRDPRLAENGDEVIFRAHCQKVAMCRSALAKVVWRRRRIV